jgi:hypothetical protein
MTWVFTLFGQSSSPNIISTSGQTYQGNSIQLDWTLGEVAVRTLENSNQQLTQGFHQPYYKITSIVELPSAFGKVEVYPNPVSKQLNISLSLEQTQKVQYQLINLQGKILYQEMMEGKVINDEISLEQIPSGSYFLRVQIVSSSIQFETFKIQKHR